jgi:prepilin-type N-terminal cleavage/methylation domain-containing protein
MKQTRGFSLIEMMVAVTLFSVVMLVSTGALLALIDATRKAQALQSVMNNLNVAVDSMVRSVRMGTNYHCGSGGVITAPQDCASGDTYFAFESFGGSSVTSADQYMFQYNPTTKRIYRSTNGGTTWFTLTAPEVQIDDLKFYTVGTTIGDSLQPKVVISIKGTAGADKQKTKATFNIQATAVQRLLDL